MLVILVQRDETETGCKFQRVHFPPVAARSSTSCLSIGRPLVGLYKGHHPNLFQLARNELSTFVLLLLVAHRRSPSSTSFYWPTWTLPPLILPIYMKSTFYHHSLHPEDVGNMVLQNTVILLCQYMVSHLRRP